MSKKLVTKDMIILDVIQKWPELMEVFFDYGVHCVGCGMAEFESIEQGAGLHGIDVDEMVSDLNEVARDLPAPEEAQ